MFQKVLRQLSPFVGFLWGSGGSCLGFGWDLVGVNYDSIGIFLLGLSPFLGLVWGLDGIGLGWCGFVMGLVWERIRPIENQQKTQ